MRTIDADTIDDYLGEWADDFYENNPDADFMDGYCMVVNKMQSHMVPTVDAVPVIRCKDCIHWYGKYHYCEVIDDFRDWDADDYCSLAEREEEWTT